MAKQTAKELILKLIGQGKTDEQIIAATLKAIPESKVDGKHCTKYRKIFSARTDDKVEAAMYSAFGSKLHQDWGNDEANAKTRVSTKCPHREQWKARAARQKAAEKAAKAA
jgi:hypothetical protein